jgi:hypothetical protein
MNITTLEKYYEQGNFDLPVIETATGGNVESAQRRMAVDASPALYRLVADQSKLDDRVSELFQEQETSDEALLDATERKDRDGKNIALARNQT